MYAAKLLFALGLSGLFAREVRAEETRFPSRSFVVENVRVFDGEHFIERASVEIRAGNIVQVRQHASSSTELPTVDGAGLTLLPGLIDAHTHTSGIPTPLRQALAFGVTTELDMFSPITGSRAIREAQPRGEMSGLADIRTAGTLITAPHGHGTQFGLPIPTLSRATDAQGFVDERITEGSDYIKLVYDDGRAVGLSFPTLSKEVLTSAIAAAHRRGKLAVVHVGSRDGARDAIIAGADGLMHLFLDTAGDGEFARLARDHGVFVVPTLSVLNALADEKDAEILSDPSFRLYLSPVDIDGLNRRFPKRKGPVLNYAAATKTIATLLVAGVPILAGTDAANPGAIHGASLHGELELLHAAGLTIEQTLAAATSLPAEKFGLKDRGRIVPGRRADLVLVKGNPQADLKATRAIVAIWKAGILFERVAYRDEIERAVNAAKATAAATPDFGDGLISDFESGRARVNFGDGWSVSTDAMIGGKSKGDFEVVAGGAHGSAQALAIRGEIDGATAHPWSGAMFSPGPARGKAANLSAMKGLRFWARGDGKTYAVILFSESRGRFGAEQSFSAGAVWKEFTFLFRDFEGLDGRDLRGILFSASSLSAGAFSFQIDDVRLVH